MGIVKIDAMLIPSASSAPRGEFARFLRLVPMLGEFCAKLVAMCLLLLPPCSFAFSQPNVVPDVDSNLYCRALSAILAKMDRSWGGIDDSDGGKRVRTDYHHMILKNLELTGCSSCRASEYSAECLNTTALIERYDALQKSFAILVGSPMVNEGTRLKIGFRIYWFEHKQDMQNYILSDWGVAYFRYTCEKQEYVIDSVALGGI